MSNRIHGKPVSEAQLDAWADEAEAGYELPQLPRPRRGRPPIGDGPSEVVTVRLDRKTLAALRARAASKGIATNSDALREAVRDWLTSA